MDDSFFGFDTSVPFEEDGAGGQIAEPSEEEYDALNDETFGSATNGDWEEAHESMVKLTDCFVPESVCGNTPEPKERKIKNVHSQSLNSAKGIHARYIEKFTDSDLELNLSGMKLDDVDLSFDDNESLSGVGGLRLDPSVWASNSFKTSAMNENNENQRCDTDSVFEFGEASASKGGYIPQYLNTRGEMVKRIDSYGTPAAPKFCTLEDIERNIIIEQTMRKQQELQSPANDSRHLHHTQRQHIQQFKEPQRQPNTPPPHFLNPQQTAHHQHNLQKPHPSQMKGPPGFLNNQVRPNSNFTNNMAQHPLLQHQTINVGSGLGSGYPVYPNAMGPHLQQQNNQLQHPLLNQHGLPSNFHRSLPSTHLPIALNNFAMHPNFNAMRAAAAVTGIHPASLVQQQQQPRIVPHPPNSAVLLNTQHSNSMYNMFNMRLVQEIQQNHPLLQNAARQIPHVQQPIGINQHQNLAQQRANISGNKTIHQRREGGSANGNLPPEDFDQYANLMSTRDKHWLIGIQLSQLNTDTPYIDDFYYTVYREKKAVKNGNVRHSQAHKDNQLNHPLTQPKGHAQLILVQLGNKNGTRNGQLRERRNSESTVAASNNCGNIGNNQDQKTPYVFTPLKFENSLGKLQYGSVTAPRKIIDADIMGSEVNVGGVGEGVKYTDSPSGNKSAYVKSNMSVSSQSGAINDIASSAHRKSRHILLHIETLFRIVLKLEDLNNPIAIATIIMKKKKENERIAALELLENANKTQEERMSEISGSSAANPALKNKFTYEIEKKEVLLAKLIAGLSHEEVPAIMNVRKGKALIRRIMPYIEDHEARWNIWMGVFSSLQNVVKKDREDLDGTLYALYPEFKKHVREANFTTIIKISSSIPLNEKKSNVIFCSKFGISSLVCLVLQAENIYRGGHDDTHTDANKGKWRNFLDRVSMSLNRTIQNQTICAEIESDSIQPMMDHFARFEDLNLDSLLQLITEAKQQIN
uniref:Protein PAT1-1 n=1 Tax=Ceratitis capitata TaxID=7213 RepID=W8BBJ3_CERCA